MDNDPEVRNMALTAFWIALAAVLIANRWRHKHLEAMRHETIRLLLQTKGDIELAEVKALLNPPRPPPPALPPGHPWARFRPDARYKAMRSGGSILMFAALGLGALIAGIGIARDQPLVVPAAVGAAVFVFLLGAGLFFASRFWAHRDTEQAA
jgi:hypothetical protein